MELLMSHESCTPQEKSRNEAGGGYGIACEIAALGRNVSVTKKVWLWF